MQKLASSSSVNRALSKREAISLSAENRPSKMLGHLVIGTFNRRKPRTFSLALSTSYVDRIQRIDPTCIIRNGLARLTYNYYITLSY